MTTPGRLASRYGAASTRMESPMAVTPCPAGGGGALVVETEWVVVAGCAGWWPSTGTMAVTWEAGSAAEAVTSPKRPRAQTTALNTTAPASTHPDGRSEDSDQSWWRIRPHWRPRAPCRTGSSTKRQDSAAMMKVAAIWRTARSALG